MGDGCMYGLTPWCAAMSIASAWGNKCGDGCYSMHVSVTVIMIPDLSRGHNATVRLQRCTTMLIDAHCSGWRRAASQSPLIAAGTARLEGTVCGRLRKHLSACRNKSKTIAPAKVVGEPIAINYVNRRKCWFDPRTMQAIVFAKFRLCHAFNFLKHENRTLFLIIASCPCRCGILVQCVWLKYGCPSTKRRGRKFTERFKARKAKIRRGLQILANNAILVLTKPLTL